ncbi:MAG: TRAP transporter small permease subunit [Burkholderiaceae bacterium]
MPPPAVQGIVRLLRFAASLAFLVLMTSVGVQIVGRLIGDSPIWTEELARFALLFLAAFGVGPSWRSGDLVNVDLVVAALPAPWPRLLQRLVALAGFGLAAVLIAPAWQFTAIGAFQTSPALEWRMDFIHGSVLVLLGALALFALINLVWPPPLTRDGEPTP